MATLKVHMKYRYFKDISRCPWCGLKSTFPIIEMVRATRTQLETTRECVYCRGTWVTTFVAVGVRGGPRWPLMHTKDLEHMNVVHRRRKKKK